MDEKTAGLIFRLEQSAAEMKAALDKLESIGSEEITLDTSGVDLDGHPGRFPNRCDL